MKRCLIIADDLTGGADAGAQFARRGLSTILVSVREWQRMNPPRCADKDVVVINTDSRRLAPKEAAEVVFGAFRDYDRENFSILYKKIDSTLRGNIGSEVDAIFRATGLSNGFFAPTFPEQGRTVAGGILMVNGNPLFDLDAVRVSTPIREPNICKLLTKQSKSNIEHIDLTHVAPGTESLRSALTRRCRTGPRIIICDAVLRMHLTHIAGAGFAAPKLPLFIGSAGLAQEVAKRIVSVRRPKPCKTDPTSHIFIVAGSMSKVTRRQLELVEKKSHVRSFELMPELIADPSHIRKSDGLVTHIREALTGGHAILETCSRVFPGSEISQVITRMIAGLSNRVLSEFQEQLDKLTLVVTGGATAGKIFDILDVKAFDIRGEILEGIIFGRLIGGFCDGMQVVTKAGGFGKDDALERTVKVLLSSDSLFDYLNQRNVETDLINIYRQKII